MIHRSPADIVGKPIVEIVGKKIFLESLPYVEAVLQGRRQEFETEVDFKDAGKRCLHVVQTPETGKDGETVGWLSSIIDITDRKESETALREAHEQLQNRAVHLEKLVQQRTARLNEMIGDLEAFSYSIVHDMRAPLRAMQGFAQLLAEESAISETSFDYVRRIKNAAQRMDRLIQDGLSYSRMMRVDLPLAPTDVAALIRGMIDTYPGFQPPEVIIEFEGTFPAVQGNEAGLTQCISNLLDNAVKFHAPGVTPHLRIWAETRNGHVRLFFKDNGIGIPPEAHGKIFEIFHRLDPKVPGTGIGLAIVKKAAERMGGKVGVISAPGEGSTFWLELARANGDSGHGNSPAESTAK
jgi:signal transduction histidine kinase